MPLPPPPPLLSNSSMERRGAVLHDVQESPRDRWLRPSTAAGTSADMMHKMDRDKCCWRAVDLIVSPECTARGADDPGCQEKPVLAMVLLTFRSYGTHLTMITN